MRNRFSLTFNDILTSWIKEWCLGETWWLHLRIIAIIMIIYIIDLKIQIYLSKQGINIFGTPCNLVLLTTHSLNFKSHVISRICFYSQCTFIC